MIYFFVASKTLFGLVTGSLRGQIAKELASAKQKNSESELSDLGGPRLTKTWRMFNKHCLVFLFSLLFD